MADFLSDFNFLIEHHACTGNAAAQKNALPLVLLQGWGMRVSVWAHWLPHLTPHFHVYCVDSSVFFDHKKNNEQGFSANFLTALLGALPENSVWLGWSLGGLVVMELAVQHSPKMRAAFFIATTPCFVQREDWQCAMPELDFFNFVQAVKTAPKKALKNFAALQGKGSFSFKEDARFLQKNTVDSAKISLAGLAYLQHQDVRSVFNKITAPVFFLWGGGDALVPAALAQQAFFANQYAALEQAAHAPFVSHPQETAAHLRQFLTPFSTPL